MLKNKHKLFAVIGRTASGKSGLVRRAVIEEGMTLVASYTTRAMRENEKNDPYVDHIFISNEEADRILKEDAIVAYTEINGVRYFATEEQLKNSDFYVIDPIGYDMLVEKIEELDIQDVELIPIYISAPKEIRKRRYLSRDNANSDEFMSRHLNENAQFNSFELRALKSTKAKKGEQVENIKMIKNADTFDKAFEEFLKIIK